MQIKHLVTGVFFCDRRILVKSLPIFYFWKHQVAMPDEEWLKRTYTYTWLVK